MTIRFSSSPPVSRRHLPAWQERLPHTARVLFIAVAAAGALCGGIASAQKSPGAEPTASMASPAALTPGMIQVGMGVPVDHSPSHSATPPANKPAAKLIGPQEVKPSAEKSLPPEKEFMAAVIQKVLDWEKNPPRPDYREHRVTTDFDGDKVDERLDEIYRITWYREKPVYVLEKKNGVPLSESSRKSQAERKKKQIDEEIANPPTKEKIDAIYLTPLLDRYTYKLVARETLDGRSAIKIKFDPIPGRFPERKIASRILESITGFAWVDEETKELMKAEVTNPDTIHIGWGIVATVSYLRIDYERKPQPDLGFWFVSSLRVRAKVRIMLFKTYNRLSESTFFDLTMP